MLQFNPADENIDFVWASNNGWEINALLAYRHLLFDNKHNGLVLPNSERIEQILMSYPIKDFDGQVAKIKASLQEIIELKKIFQSL